MTQPAGCCLAQPIYKNDTVEVTCCSLILLIMAVAIIVFSSVEAAGVFASGDFNGAFGLAFRHLANGAAIEGGIGVASGAIAAAIIVARMFSPNLRNICSDPNPNPNNKVGI